MDIIILYPAIWATMVVLGLVGYAATDRRADVYLIIQLLIMAVVLFVLRDTFGTMDWTVWTVYAIGFASYIVAFLAGASTRSIGWVVIFQGIAFAVSYLVLPFAFGLAGGAG